MLVAIVRKNWIKVSREIDGLTPTRLPLSLGKILHFEVNLIKRPQFRQHFWVIQPFCFTKLRNIAFTL